MEVGLSVGGSKYVGMMFWKSGEYGREASMWVSALDFGRSAPACRSWPKTKRVWDVSLSSQPLGTVCADSCCAIKIETPFYGCCSPRTNGVDTRRPEQSERTKSGTRKA